MKKLNKWNVVIILLLGLILGILIYINIDIFLSKNIWDWLTLLILPISMAGGAVYFQHTQKKRELKQIQETKERELILQKEKHLVDNYKYFYSKMLEFILIPNFKSDKNILLGIKILTLSSFRKFDALRKKEALIFLYEADLLNKIALNNINLDNVKIKNLQLYSINFSKSNFNNFSLLSSLIKYSNLSECTFADSNLTGTNFQNCDFTNIKFERSTLKGCFFQHKANRELEENYYIRFNMYGVTFLESKLQKSNFNYIFFNGGIFKRTNLTSAFFNYCKFENITFYQSILDNSKFSNCRFINCVFKESSNQNIILQNNIFDNCNFEYLDLSDINLTSNTFKTTTFINVSYNKNTKWKGNKVPDGCFLTTSESNKISKEIYKLNNEQYIEFPIQQNILQQHSIFSKIKENKDSQYKNPIVYAYTVKNDPITVDNIDVIIAESKNILTFLTNNKQAIYYLKEKGLNINVLDEILDYRFDDNFNFYQLGFITFVDFIRYITCDTNIKLVLKSPSDYRLVFKGVSLDNFEDVICIKKLGNINTIDNYKKLLEKGKPTFKQFSKEKIKIISDYLSENKQVFQNILLSDITNKLSNNIEMEEDEIKKTIFTLISASCFLKEPEEAKLSEQKLSFIPQNTEQVFEFIYTSMRTKLINVLENIDDEIFKKIIG